MYTVEEAIAWAVDNREMLDAARKEHTPPEVEILERFQPELMQKLWDSGSWLKGVLLASGVDSEQ